MWMQIMDHVIKHLGFCSSCSQQCGLCSQRKLDLNLMSLDELLTLSVSVFLSVKWKQIIVWKALPPVPGI